MTACMYIMMNGAYVNDIVFTEELSKFINILIILTIPVMPGCSLRLKDRASLAKYPSTACDISSKVQS